MSEARRILIVEDSRGTASGYRELLEREGAGYDCTVCITGIEAVEVIDSGMRFDLAVMDIILPPEDGEKALEESHETGLRLMEMMIEKGTCRRFYVITVSGKQKVEIERICKGRAVFLFECKYDNEPSMFTVNVAELLGKPVPRAGT